MALILTKEQETALLAIAQEQVDLPAKKLALEAAQADLDDVHARLMEAKREADWTVTSSYIAELTAKQQAYEDAKTAIAVSNEVTEVVK